MPIQENYREEALSKLGTLCSTLEGSIHSLLEEADPEDLEFGLKLELEVPELESLWQEAIEENNYMQVVFTEVMEHHDGAYLKATFRNELGRCYADRYISVWSSGRVELSYALFMEIGNIRVRVERKGQGIFGIFAQSV